MQISTHEQKTISEHSITTKCFVLIIQNKLIYHTLIILSEHLSGCPILNQQSPLD